MQDLKDNKHLTEFGISQETIDFVNSTKDKYKIIPNFGEFKEHGVGLRRSIAIREDVKVP